MVDLCFIADVCFRHGISKLRRPIEVKFCAVIENMPSFKNYVQKVKKCHKNKTKTCKIWRNFGTSNFDCEYLWNVKDFCVLEKEKVTHDLVVYADVSSQQIRAAKLVQKPLTILSV